MRTRWIEGKCVVVTGGASGIGAALARRFAAEGARGVVVADVQDEALEAVAREIGDGLAVPCDVTDEAQIRALVDRAEDRFGPIDLFCSNAGIVVPGGADASDEIWRRSIDVNVMAHVYAARDLVPRMIERGERLPAADRVGRGPAHPDRERARTRSRSTRRSRSRSGSRSPTATRGSRCRCSRRRRCAPR